MKALIKSLVLLAAGCSGTAFAQEFYVGGHVGAVGSDSDSKIGYGVHLGSDPSGLAAFQIDFTTAPFDGGTYFSSSPAVVIYPVNYEEFKLGVMAGAGFYKLPVVSTKFGLNAGVTGDFKLAKEFSVGMEARYHEIFSTDNNVWTVFLTLRYHFEMGGGW
ncbi:MAG: hypothetical protein JST16_01985 [Bdellovibrionales bacterium]|nr:hypothetical protein [Bdellovibrionales bacterium]